MAAASYSSRPPLTALMTAIYVRSRRSLAPFSRALALSFRRSFYSCVTRGRAFFFCTAALTPLPLFPAVVGQSREKFLSRIAKKRYIVARQTDSARRGEVKEK